MPISFAEEILTLTQASKILPRRNGKRPSIGTLWRWCRFGIKGVHLEYACVGRTMVTTRRALETFFNQLASVDPSRREPVSFRELPKRSSAQMQASQTEARRVLDAAGV